VDVFNIIVQISSKQQERVRTCLSTRGALRMQGGCQGMGWLRICKISGKRERRFLGKKDAAHATPGRKVIC